MSNIDKRALREAAEKAISEEGETWWSEEQLASDYGLALHKADAKFIAAANPATVLALLDELEAKDKSISFLKDQLAQLANFNPDWDKLEAATDSLREHMAELTAARKRIAELEATQGKPVMFIDGDISPADAEKLAAVIREFNEETETPAARMARIIRENPHPTNMCDMPVAAAGKGEAS
ncbi:TPA: ead/Ea22-like family protein [Escherichia coli]|nr:ead/Ea22-like family protein [Escherichia coli]